MNRACIKKELGIENRVQFQRPWDSLVKRKVLLSLSISIVTTKGQFSIAHSDLSRFSCVRLEATLG